MNKYYGTDQPEQPRPPNITGAGHPPDKAELDMRIAEDQSADTQHDGVDVPPQSSPFTIEQEEVFFQALDKIERLSIIPLRYSVAPEEWSTGEYPTSESIWVGSGWKEINVDLPSEIWWPQAVKSVQGLDFMLEMGL